MDDVKLKFSLLIVDEIIEKEEKLCKIVREGTDLPDILGVTQDSCLRNLATLKNIEKKLQDGHTATMSEVNKLRDSLLVMRNHWSASTTPADACEIITPDPLPTTISKIQHTPPSPSVAMLQNQTKTIRVDRVPSSDDDNMPPPSAPPRATRSRSSSVSTRGQPVIGAGISARSLTDALAFVESQNPRIELPRCDAQIRNSSTIPATQVNVNKYQLHDNDEIAAGGSSARQFIEPAAFHAPITRWASNGAPLPDQTTTIYVRSSPVMTTQSSQTQNESVNQEPDMPDRSQFDLRHRLSRSSSQVYRGRGQSQVLHQTASASSSARASPGNTRLRTEQMLAPPPANDMQTPYPPAYLNRYGGVPPVYSVYLDRLNTEWPTFLQARIPPFEWRGVFLDRHAAASVIGEMTIPAGSPGVPLASRLHVDLPWRGRGDPFFFTETVMVEIMFDGGSVRIKQKFGVVRALQNAVILGQDFAVRNGVWLENATDGSRQVHIRGTVVPGKKALRAYQVPDDSGGYRPRDFQDHYDHYGPM